MNPQLKSVLHDLLFWPGLFFATWAGLRMFTQRFDKKLRDPDDPDEQR